MMSSIKKSVFPSKAKVSGPGVRDEIQTSPTLYQELSPMRWLMFLLMLWPIRQNQRGAVEAPFRSVLYVYTLPMYIFLSLINLSVFKIRWDIFVEHLGDFSEIVFYSVFLLLLMPHWFTPLIHWPEAERFADYFNHWTQYQALWKQSLGVPLHLGIRRRALTAAVLGVAFPLSLCIIEVPLTDDVTAFQGIAYYFSASFFFVTTQSWILLTHMITTTCNQLAESFKQAANSNTLTPDLVRRYCALWMELRRLTNELGRAQAATMLHYLGQSMLYVVVTSFGIQIVATHQVYNGIMVCLLLLDVDNIVHAFIANDSGYSCAQHINKDMRDLLLPYRNKDQDIMYEIKAFLDSIASHPSEINLGGFTSCSRSGIINVFKWVFTNLLVMLQFAYFLPTGQDTVNQDFL